MNGYIWAAHAVEGSAGTNSAIQWYQIEEATNTVVQWGLIEETITPRDFHEPSIAVNGGIMVIGYTASGPSTFASAMASVGVTVMGAIGPSRTFSAPMVLQPGAGNYYWHYGTGRNRWGDYSATCVDPTDPTKFWTFQEYVAVAQQPPYTTEGGA